MTISRVGQDHQRRAWSKYLFEARFFRALRQNLLALLNYYPPRLRTWCAPPRSCALIYRFDLPTITFPSLPILALQVCLLKYSHSNMLLRQDLVKPVFSHFPSFLFIFSPLFKRHASALMEMRSFPHSVQSK